MRVRVPFFSEQCRLLERSGWVVMEVNPLGSALLRKGVEITHITKPLL